jgi:NitT/TauT family transport system substrate-binding protein
MIRRILFPGFIALSLLLAGCQPAAQTPPPTPAPLLPIRLPMGYIPNVQYAPYYVAVEKGYFRQAGVEVTFDYSFETDGIQLVGANELPFTLASGEQVLLARAQGLPVTTVLSWYQEYPVAVVARAEAGVKTPADLKGKRIGLPGLFGANYIGLRALLGAAGLSESDVTIESIGFNQVEALTAGQQDIIVGYAANEPVQLRAQGLPIDVLLVSDYVQLASNGLVTNQATLEQNPDLARRMTAAIRRGIQDVIDDPNAAYEICKNYVEGLATADEAVQRQVLAVSIEYWKGEVIGRSDPNAWENMQRVLLEIGLIPAPLELDKAFTNEFIP